MTSEQFHLFARRMVAGLIIFAAFGVISLVLQGIQNTRVSSNVQHIDELRIRGDAVDRRLARIAKAQVEQNRRGIEKNKAKVKRLTRIVVGTPGKPGIGSPGGRGINGVRGPFGARGSRGPTGLTGLARVGPAGPFGPTGPFGKDGVDGVDGADGTNGVDGAKGDTGATGPEPVSFTFVVGVVTYTCTDPDGDGNYECASPGP